MEESGVTDRRLFEALALGVGEGGDTVNIVSDALHEVATTVGDGGGGADGVGMNVVRSRGASVIDIEAQQFIDAVTLKVLFGHLT